MELETGPKLKFWIQVLIILLQLKGKPTFSTWIGFQQHLFTHIEHHGGVLPGGGPPCQKGHSVDGDIIVKCWHHIYEVILSVSFKHLKIIDKIKILGFSLRNEDQIFAND